MEFTDKGREAFARVTKRDRAARLPRRSPARPARPASQSDRFQRFAITLDNQIVSLATIDFLDNPEGIDGRTGAQIENIGTTPADARTWPRACASAPCRSSSS